MTSEDVRSELERHPFVGIRFHLVSGKTVDVMDPGLASMLQNAVVVLHPFTNTAVEPGHDILSLRNIERLERFDSPVDAGGDNE